jgi:hypothetical protein
MAIYYILVWYIIFKVILLLYTIIGKYLYSLENINKYEK